MKKSTTLLLALVALLMMSSCVSTKKIVYFQDPNEVVNQGEKILQQYEMRLKPADQVLVKVTCSEPDLLAIFAQDVMMGTSGTYSSQNISSTGNMTNAYGYTVSNEGFITLPAVGRVEVAGLTSDEAGHRIEECIIAANLIKDPEVTVRLLNARVAVLGAGVDIHEVLVIIGNRVLAPALCFFLDRFIHAGKDLFLELHEFFL